MMSGGVDSSVAAYLLKKEGYEVSGVTLKLGGGNGSYTKGSGPCFSENINIARKAAQQMGIPHHVWDFTDELRKTVIADFLKNYLKGKTPNPCSRCNKWVKFGVVLKKARSLGYDYLATGHHARIDGNGVYYLKKGKDEKKDQSYFLHHLNQETLPHILFPIGEYRKGEVRDLASGIDLPSAGRPESQEICFLPDDDYRRFIKENTNHGEYRSGEIVDTEGNILGTHKGIPFYTVGQRRGLGLKIDRKYYVVEIDPQDNCIVVGGEEDLYSNRLIASRPNFIYATDLNLLQRVAAKIRYGTDPAPASIQKEKNHLLVTFDRPQRAITPGQIVVFYKGDKVFGGGTIKEVL